MDLLVRKENRVSEDSLVKLELKDLLEILVQRV